MAKKKLGGAVGKGGVNPAPSADSHTVRVAAEQLVLVPIDDLVPYANNAKVHTPEQINQIRGSLREFGFVTPVLIDFDNNIIAGHGRVMAARAEGMTEVPCVMVSNLSDTQRKAYILADNRMSEIAQWDLKTLEVELEGLRELDFNVDLIGFEPDDIKEIQVGAYTRTAPGQAESSERHFWGDEEGQTTEEYNEFLDKFKPKLTTDDCFTPANIYEVVRDWAVRRYGLEGCSVIRPFYPGGNYAEAEYPEGCVVIDNPPFSILSEICRFYAERDIPYFLFAPGLTLFSIASGSCNYLPIGAPVTYENGATVNTSFVTNLGSVKIEIAPDLYQVIDEENDKNLRELHAELPNYVYPDCVVSVGVNKLAKWGQPLKIMAKDAQFIRALDAQKEAGKAIFGGGFLLSEKAAAEKAAAEKAAAEKAAAEKAAAEKAAAEKAAATEWSLSEREQLLVQQLGKE